jgi:hypothetical protein
MSNDKRDWWFQQDQDDAWVQFKLSEEAERSIPTQLELPLENTRTREEIEAEYAAFMERLEAEYDAFMERLEKEEREYNQQKQS